MDRSELQKVAVEIPKISMRLLDNILRVFVQIVIPPVSGEQSSHPSQWLWTAPDSIAVEYFDETRV